MEVTEEYLVKLQSMGSSENTSAGNLVGSKSLIYAKGPSMQRAIPLHVTSIPWEFQFKGELGMMGAENIFYKISLDIKDTGAADNCFEERGYVCMRIDLSSYDESPGYVEALIDFNAPEFDDEWIGANLTTELPFSKGDEVILASLENVGTGNQYVDKSIDVRLYGPCRFEHEFDDMWVGLSQYHFYVGIHQRETKRGSYNVKCKIGTTFRDRSELTADEKQLLPICP